jgi:general secretion pathway protein G
MIYREKQQTLTLRRSAFTLMEMLVVVAIIVALAGLGGFYVMGALEDAKKDTAHIQCKVLKDAVQRYMMKNKGQIPPSIEALKAASDGGTPILEKDAKTDDPWGQPYQIDPPDASGQVGVYSLGPPGTGKQIR